MQLLMIQIYQGIDTFLNIVSVGLIAYALLSWFMRPDHPIYMFLARFADFILTPFRPAAEWLFRKGFRIDMSVVLALLSIEIVRTVLANIVYRMM